ncbi:MAG: hypothetical protein ACLR2E_16600 [Lachnospiraceae bacterium]
MIWNMIYHNKYGILNWFLKAIGRPDLCQVWLNNSKLVMLLVTIPLIWQYIGYYMVILQSAIASIGTDVLEECGDRRSQRRTESTVYYTCHLSKIRFLSCVLPLYVAGNMKAFDNILRYDKGGPGTASMVMAMYGYQISLTRATWDMEAVFP